MHTYFYTQLFIHIFIYTYFTTQHNIHSLICVYCVVYVLYKNSPNYLVAVIGFYSIFSRAGEPMF